VIAASFLDLRGKIMSGGKRQWIRENLGTFLQQYARKAQRGVEPNDRHYDRNLEAKLKRMNPEDLSRLMTGDDGPDKREDE
jgi:hypothetical protein